MFVMQAAVVDWRALEAYGNSHLRCPRPDKQTFASAYEALEAHVELLARDPRLEVYSCRAGHWHTGHPRHMLNPRASNPRKHLAQPVGTLLDKATLDRLDRLRWRNA